MSTEPVIHEHKVFSHIDYTEKKLRHREFYKCKFEGCVFVKSDLRTNSFEDCTFESCNFTMTNIEGAGFRNAIFKNCKLLGLDFTACNTFMFSFKFEECLMDYCIFYGSKLKKTPFIQCSLKEVDFTEADLSSASFSKSDLSGAKFSNTVLEKTDFRGATNFSIEPEFNKMKKAKFSSYQLEGLLYKYQLDIDYDG
jgi:uncharacterized protein YjbI with pentapeptide repeats